MIDLSTLMIRLGRIGKVLRASALYRAAGLGTDVDDLISEYDALRSVAAPVTDRLPASKSAAGDLVGTLLAAAQATAVEACRSDQSARSWTVEEAAAEVVRQLGLLTQTVPACDTAVSATALSPFAGDGLLVTTILGGGSEPVAGVELENVFAETLWLTCTQDAQTGGQTRGRELFRFRGGVAETDLWGDLWPAGSGGDGTFLCADPTGDAEDGDGGNLLTNSDFEDFTANVPDNWAIQVGAAGTEIARSTSQQYAGSACLALAGSATLAAIAQDFDDADGTSGVLLPLTRYALSVRVKVSAVPATGTLVLELADSANAVVNSQAGSPLRLTIDLTAAATSYAAYTAVLVTPRALPTTARFRLRVGTAIEAGKTAFVAHLCLDEMHEAYPGGPAAAVVSGATPFALGDGWTLAADNDRAGSDYGSTWQALFDRLFGMRDLGLQLPSTAGTPTYDDGLITG